MATPFDLNNKTVLVTGASSGIGRQTAISISRMGGKLIITGRDEKRLSETISSLEGDHHAFICGDLILPEFIEQLADFCGTLNGVVHCAGILRPYPIRFISKKEINDMFDINYTAPVLVTARLLKKKKIAESGSLVFITSISGTHRPYYGGALYAGTKSALESFSKVLAIEHASKKIRSNCISPAIVKTPIFDEYMGGVADQKNVDEYEKKYPLGFGEPADVANAAIYLLSEASRWVTGTTIFLDGGLMVS
jgi:NAD(P)-dependent dehydrogenase (short-subunit alcohol dehydrogenase family)